MLGLSTNIHSANFIWSMTLSEKVSYNFIENTLPSASTVPSAS